MFARTSLRPIDSLDFLACVLGVPFVHNVFERNKIVVAVYAVVAVVYGDKSHVVLRKQNFRVHSDLNVITSKTAHILDYHGFNLAALNITSFETVTLKGCTRNSVINVKPSVEKAFFLGILRKQFLLIFD